MGYSTQCIGQTLLSKTLNALSLALKIETFLAFMFNDFTHSLKCALDAIKLVEILHTKGNKLLKNIKTILDLYVITF